MMLKTFIPVIVLVTGIVSMESCSKSSNNATQPALRITSFTPAGGIRGSFVLINGTNFSTTAAENIVTINGITATVYSATPTSLVAVVPAGAGIGRISVKVGAAKDSSVSNYLYAPGISTLAGASYGYIDGKGIDALFNYPSDIASDASGNIYVADRGNNRIRKITPTGVVSTVAGDGTAAYKEGTGTNAAFKAPTGLAVDASGNIYVADRDNNRIRKITPAGVVSTFAGDGTPAYREGTGTAAEFNSPAGVALDASGNVYVADAGNQRIRKITSAGVVSTLAGSGAASFKDGTGTGAAFNNPNGIAVDASGNIYVTDFTNDRVRKITPSGVVSTVAGDGNFAFADGAGTSAEFYYIYRIAIDASGNLYVTDDINDRIRKITPAGVVTTLAGDGTPGYTEGSLKVAEFSNPTGVAIDPSGIMYIIDGSLVRKIQ